METREVDYENLLFKVGDFGLFQKILLGFYCLRAFPLASQIIGVVFIAARPNHWCQSNELSNLSLPEMWNRSLPLETNADGGTSYSQCQKFANFTSGADGGLVSCGDSEGWSFDTSTYTKTIAMEWDLVCESRWLHSLSSAAFLAGCLVGGLFVGPLADVIGRKKAIIFCDSLAAIGGVTTIFCVNYPMFLAMRLISGIAAVGTITIYYLLMSELVAARKRRLLGLVAMFAWTSGYIGTAATAYLIRDWRWLQAALTVPSVILLPTLLYIPESPRFLFTNGRAAEAYRVIGRLASINKRKAPAHIEVFIPKGDQSTSFKVFRDAKVRWCFLMMAICRFAANFVYYGLSLASGNLSGDAYMNTFLLGLVEFPSTVAMYYLALWMGRRWAMAFCALGAAVCVIFIGLLPPVMTLPILILATGGKLFISMEFGLAIMTTSEVMPTVARGTTASYCTVIGKIGAVTSSFVWQLADYGRWLPTAILAGSMIIACIAGLFVPETKGMKLPDTTEDLERFGGGHRYLPRPFFSFGPSESNLLDEKTAEELPLESKLEDKDEF